MEKRCANIIERINTRNVIVHVLEEEVHMNFDEIGRRPCEIAWCRENCRRIAGSCSILLDQTDCDQAVRST